MARDLESAPARGTGDEVVGADHVVAKLRELRAVAVVGPGRQAVFLIRVTSGSGTRCAACSVGTGRWRGACPRFRRRNPSPVAPCPYHSRAARGRSALAGAGGDMSRIGIDLGGTKIEASRSPRMAAWPPGGASRRRAKLRRHIRAITGLVAALEAETRSPGSVGVGMPAPSRRPRGLSRTPTPPGSSGAACTSTSNGPSAGRFASPTTPTASPSPKHATAPRPAPRSCSASSSAPAPGWRGGAAAGPHGTECRGRGVGPQSAPVAGAGRVAR